MSTRFYPLYQPGNPQLRIFLPNFWLKLVQSKTKQPKNVVKFHCSMEMTKFDVRNYLEKIYNVYPADIRTVIVRGKASICHRDRSVIKEDDVKVAFVTLKKDNQFTFPDLFPPSTAKTMDESLEEFQQKYAKYEKLLKPKHSQKVCSWFAS